MLLGEVANRSGIPADECGVVLKTFERVHLNLRSVKVFRLGGTQCLHVGQIAGAVNGGVLRLPQLLPDVAGEVFVRRLPVAVHRLIEKTL